MPVPECAQIFFAGRYTTASHRMHRLAGQTAQGGKKIKDRGARAPMQAQKKKRDENASDKEGVSIRGRGHAKGNMKIECKTDIQFSLSEEPLSILSNSCWRIGLATAISQTAAQIVQSLVTSPYFSKTHWLGMIPRGNMVTSQ